MALIKFNPVTPGTRFGNVSDFAEITKAKPYKPLTEIKKRTGGRNNHGHITSRHRIRKRTIRHIGQWWSGNGNKDTNEPEWACVTEVGRVEEVLPVNVSL